MLIQSCNLFFQTIMYYSSEYATVDHQFGALFGAHLAPDNYPPEANPHKRIPFLVILLLVYSLEDG